MVVLGRCVLLLATCLLASWVCVGADGGAPPSRSRKTSLSDADVGNWTVGDCLMAQFAMSFSLHANVSNPNATTAMVFVSPRASSESQQSNCGNTTEELKLRWIDESKNNTGLLQRNLTITFERRNTTLYGVSRLYGYFEMGHFTWENPKTNKTVNATSFVSVDTGNVDILLFKVPFKRSFLCADLGDWSVTSLLHYSFSNEPPLGTKMANATISTKKVQFDAFRDKYSPPHYFRSPIDCEYEPNDIVPLLVGIALVAVVVFVLCAYMYGRRQRRMRGYENI